MRQLTAWSISVLMRVPAAWPVPLLACALVLTVGIGPEAQVQSSAQAPLAQGPRFRAGTDTVPVYATVRDPSHGFVTDLTQDDFEIRDDGKVQKITQFALSTQPLSMMILIDGSGSMIPEFNRALEAARSLVLRMLPDDRARIGSFADRVVLGPRFTSDRDELLGFLTDEFSLRLGTTTHLWEGLLDSAQALDDERGKRVIVVMSDGYNFVLPPGYENGSPSGGSATPGSGPGRGRPPIVGGPNGGPVGLGGRNPTGGTAPTGPTGMGYGGASLDPEHFGVPLDEVRTWALGNDTIIFGVSMWVRDGVSAVKPHRDLERLALETGGGTFQVDVNEDMHAPFGEIIQQLRQQYLLGFVPANRDGKRHALSVKVKRPHVDVRARTSYVAPGPAR